MWKMDTTDIVRITNTTNEQLRKKKEHPNALQRLYGAKEKKEEPNILKRIWK